MPLIVPAELKKVTQFVRRAEELDGDSSAESRVVAYYCRQYAVQSGIPLAGSSAEAKNCLGQLLSDLETEKKAMAVFSREESKLICRKFADTVFDRADAVDRAGQADKNTARTFYAAATFYEILLQFANKQKQEQEQEMPESDKEEENRRIYCKWKATEILKAVREGRSPTPGGYNRPEDTPTEQTVEQTVEQTAEQALMPSAPTLSTLKNPTMEQSDDEDEDEDEQEGTEVQLSSASISAPPLIVPDIPPPSYNTVNVEQTDETDSDEEVVIPNPPPPPTKKKSKKFQFGTKKKAVSKQVFADAAELTRFAMKALEEKDAELAVERLSQALQILGH